MMRSNRRGGLAVTGMAVAIVGVLAGGPAQGADDSAVGLGQKLYTQYCASCHGADGKGNGPAAGTGAAKPTDLTQIAKKNGGKFPFYEVMLQISGRGPTSQNADASLPGLPKAHGDPKMPVWGEVFSREELSKGTSLDLQLQTTGKVMMITEYLQSIQAK
jgi:mono/diheme cytochrome c family protein